MPYTFQPKYRYAKTFGRDLRISNKSATIICRAIRNKTLVRSKRLLSNLLSKKQSLDGKYYTKTAKAILQLLEGCEKNAEFLGLDADRLFVHASAHMGPIVRRRRRKSAFGSRLKSTGLEILLIERGISERVSREKIVSDKQSKVEKEIRAEESAVKKEINDVNEKNIELAAKLKENT